MFSPRTLKPALPLTATIIRSAVGRTFSTVKQPELGYAYNALEPHISADIMETHYSKHHKNYTNTYNASIEKYLEAVEAGDLVKQNALARAVKFNAGGYVNHNLFWKSLLPVAEGGGKLPAAESALGKAIVLQYGSFDKLIELIDQTQAGLQGAGWTWLVKDKTDGKLDVITTANQDMVPSKYSVILALDNWEHAYYLQYKNVKAEYFKAVWNVINWKEAERRYEQ